MPLIDPPSTPIVDGAPYPALLYGPSGVIVTVWTAEDAAAAAIEGGFGATPLLAFDYSNVHQSPQISYSTFNYSRIDQAQTPWNWGPYGFQGEHG